MASFEELQIIAAARSKASQEKLAAERAKREAIEREKKLALDSKARHDIQKERDSLVAREHKRKRDEEQRKQLEMEKRKLIEKRERENKEREKYGMDVVKFRNATQKAITNAGGSAKLKSKSKGRNKEHQDSVSPPPSMREYSTLTREEKRKKKEAVMLGLAISGKRKATSSSYHQHPIKKGPGAAASGLMPLGLQKRDTRSVDEIERDLAASRKAKLTMQGNESQRDKLLEKDIRMRDLENTLRRTKAMQQKRSMEEATQREMSRARSASGSSEDERERRRNGKRIESPAILKSKAKSQEGHSSNSFGLSPADYLPGAPIKASLLPKKAIEPPQVPTYTKSKKEVSKAVIEKTGPLKKETPREKFLREEAERKKRLERNRGANDESDSDEEEEGSGSEHDEDESEDDESEERSSKRAKVRNEIWKMFNRRDRSEYIARDIDSDDDMEADMESVQREEEISARIARLEDKREEEVLRRKEEEKAQRKAARSRH